ncbi:MULTISPECIES: EamA family transporter RarD [Pasteurellaceae]|uniref:EamA family transporter RarD n=1 Tax=Pasteurella atlantica TaxID=2827233 RepID=A0AAW8CNI0_9PAST|nr:EamA family transporter RarD [Pasteurella atlantica]MBR0573815.1 EamA family transporter RarD [Pasteurella atlantica]MDP8039751.1 EamA family transporter RarD [Pasteurella atlantica]MDP8041936.1 EamA family transporter RarD [Pasteurella atlantica]MDP8044039.1 EamA family transporter RarD [Pasteurella atlantica]MDP8046017.1 EamA family transporter RarD [Pasteurella atlantica]
MKLSVGLIQAILAYSIWGLFPLYWALLKSIPATEIIAHRILWSFVLLLIVIIARNKLIQVFHSVKTKKNILILLITSLLISGNWLIYIWAVTNGHILESSLGYYISPLCNVLLGIIFLGERLRPLQTIAVFLALFSVIFLTIVYGQIPFIALGLASTVAIYALLRKKVSLDTQTAMFIETGLIVIPAALYILFGNHSQAIFNGSLSTQLLLICGGIVTLLPLMLMTNSLKTLQLSTIGFLQYISPTLQFFCGLVVFGEAFDMYKFIGFIFIWIAILIYSFDALLYQKKANFTQRIKDK